MYSISMILPYFTRGTGKWPNYIDWHFASCKANSTINFYIFTDDHSISRWEKTENIHITYMSFEECGMLVKEKLGNEVAITKPYKLCDYKPAYWDIFGDIIGETDYWGFYDCDTIFGNLRKYYTDELLDRYEKLNVLGQFQLFRNREDINKYYCLERDKNSKYYFRNWKDISRSEDYEGYDEGTGLPMLLREQGKNQLWEYTSYANIHQPAYYKHLFDKDVKRNRLFQLWHWSASEGIYHIDMLTKKKSERTFIHFTQRSLKCDEYNNQTEIYVTQKSELKPIAKLGDSFTGFEYFVLMTKKILTWIGWKITHIKGKKAWEM